MIFRESWARLARLVERGVVIGADEAAVAAEKRRVVGQGAREFGRERRVKTGERDPGLLEFVGKVAAERRREARGRFEAGADAGQIAGPAPPETEPRQSSRHVRRPGQSCPQAVPEVPVGEEMSHRILPPHDRGHLRERPGKPLAEKAAASGRQRAVDCGEERPGPFAG
jgi:hypothetical protein